jgi:hypothetical protein
MPSDSNTARETKLEVLGMMSDEFVRGHHDVKEGRVSDIVCIHASNVVVLNL